MRYLLLGASGQVGWELKQSLAPLGKVHVCQRPEVDLESPDALRKVIAEHKPDIIVNAAAYTAVDKAESEPEKAYAVNAKAVQVLAEEAKHYNAWLVHYSTDYVFDGQKATPYLETDQPSPLNVYGKTKQQGEQAITEVGCRHIIFRTSWVFSHRGTNFAKTILRLAAEKSELKIVCDQMGAPTSASLIAEVTALIAHSMTLDPSLAAEVSGVYHLTSSGKTSWHQYAQHLVQRAWKKGISLKSTPESILPITTADYPRPAKRPANSSLDLNKIQKHFQLSLPSWQEEVDRFVAELPESVS